MSCRTALLIAIALFAIPTVVDAQVRNPRSGVFGRINPNDRWNSQTYRPWYGNLGHYANQFHLGNRVQAQRPWTGYGGATFGFRPGEGYGLRGTPDRTGTFALPPYVIDNGPSIVTVPRSNLGNQDADNDNIFPSEQPTPRTEKEKKPAARKSPRPSMPSSPETIARSERKQQLGDDLLRKLDYAGALSHYRAAILIAPDRAEPRFRLGFVLAATSEFSEGVEQIKFGLEIDGNWPSKQVSFEDLIGSRNVAEKSAIQNRAADWVKEDVRDADRLFLMGVLLHLDRSKQAAVFFDTAYKIAGEGNHLTAFLNPVAASPKATSTALPLAKLPVEAQPPVAAPVPASETATPTSK